jgi:diadenosine tetraphosphate (Ap4A) HIT family hydrolase
VTDGAVERCFLCQDALLQWVVRESPQWRIVVNRNQNLLGKLCIVLRRHEESVAGLTEDEWAELRGEIVWAVDRLSRAFTPDHFNHAFLQNQDAHVHLHVIPRYAGVRHFGGIEFADPEYGDHYGLDRQERVTVEFARELGAALAAGY